MKIWIIGRNYPTAQNSMAGSFELEQAKMLAKFGHDVCYLAVGFSFMRKGNPRGITCRAESKVRIYSASHLYFPGKLGINLGAWKDYCWKRFFESIDLSESLPDIIHIHYPALVGRKSPIQRYLDKGCKLIITEHWTHVLLQQLRQREYRQLNYFAGRAGRIICVSAPLGEAVADLTGQGQKIRIIPNIVSGQFYWAKPTSDTFTFVAVGRFVKVKQFDKILQAFAASFEQQQHVRLLLIGDGPEYNRLVKQSKRLHVYEQVEFTGMLDRKSVADKIAHADALICFSRLETFGVPVIEAWASGKPVIASDKLGFPEYWKDELGEIVRSDQTNSLAKAMIRMAADRERYKPDEIMKFASAHFSEEAVCCRMNSIYEEALA